MSYEIIKENVFFEFYLFILKVINFVKLMLSFEIGRFIYIYLVFVCI